MTTDRIHLAQITDTHLFAKSERDLLGVPTEKTFQSVLAAVKGLDPLPQVLLLTGDLSQDGSAKSYARLRSSLAELSIDTYWLAGNHDRLAPMQAELCGQRLFPDKAFSRGKWSFILINSLVPGKDSGYLEDETLEFLAHRLEATAAAGQHVVVSLHHPPFVVKSRWLDGSGLQDPERFFQVLDRFSHVRLVLFGHIHQEFCHSRRDVEYLACPSTCIQFQPLSQEFQLEVVPPGFRQVWLEADGSFQTQVTRVSAALISPNLQLQGY